MKKQIQRRMKFDGSIDTAEAKGEHKFYFKFTSDFIKGKKVLNVGSWTGPYEILAHKSAASMTSVDIEQKALDVLKKSMPKVNVKKAFSHDLPFKDSSFDVVTFFDVIEHIPRGYELASIKEIARVLKKGGVFFLATPHANFLSKFFDPAYLLAGHRHYSKEELVAMLETSGFKVDKSMIAGSFVSSFYALAFYFFKHALRMKLPNLKLVEKSMERDIASPGYIQIILRSTKTKS